MMFRLSSGGTKTCVGDQCGIRRVASFALPVMKGGKKSRTRASLLTELVRRTTFGGGKEHAPPLSLSRRHWSEVSIQPVEDLAHRRLERDDVAAVKHDVPFCGLGCAKEPEQQPLRLFDGIVDVAAAVEQQGRCADTRRKIQVVDFGRRRLADRREPGA